MVKTLMALAHSFRLALFLGSLFFLAVRTPSPAEVLINEIHFIPALKTERAEFIELHNSGIEEVDLSGWKFSKGITFNFPSGAKVPAGGFLLLAQDTNAFSKKFNRKAFGQFTGKLSNQGEALQLQNASDTVMDEVDYQLGFPWPTVGDGPGPSIELIHPLLDNSLGGHWRPGLFSKGRPFPGTPGETNSSYTTNFPAAIRQVKHLPENPASGVPMRITARVTHSQGISNVVLHYQIVEPGDYFQLDELRYRTSWKLLPMNDQGEASDQKKGDEIFTGQIPAETQKHRRLIRYRIQITDVTGGRILVPYPEDPQPNFAYFVYDGLPVWKGAIEPKSRDPRRSQVVDFSSNALGRLPVYYLLSRKSSVEASNWREHYGGDDYKWYGTLVYHGKVYDHLRYRARGGSWRYAMGKNMWKFDFHRGHDFEARNNYGKKYQTAWTKLNLGACIQQGDYGHRGEQGMFESVGFKLFNLAGVEAPHTHFVHLRVIDEPLEFRNQYAGDFWGLYLAIEDMDGRFLDEHGLPDGNLYKMEHGSGELKNLGTIGPMDKSDLNLFMRQYSQGNPPDAWWQQNLDLSRYYSYRSIVEGMHHYDIDQWAAKNYFYFLNPASRRWTVLPWDIDLSWADSMYGGGEDTFKQRVLSRPAFNLEYQNRLREIRDLLWNTNQAWQLIEDFAALIDDPKGGPSMVKADRALWDYNPILAAPQHIKGGQGLFYQAGPSHDFPGMVQLMKNYVVRRAAWIDANLLRDSAIPATPSIGSSGSLGLSKSELTFRAAPFTGTPPTGIKWRVGAVDDSESLKRRGQFPGKYEIAPAWESAELPPAQGAEIKVPPAAVKAGNLYRLRLRAKDRTGRWSHWSSPVEFRIRE